MRTTLWIAVLSLLTFCAACGEIAEGPEPSSVEERLAPEATVAEETGRPPAETLPARPTAAAPARRGTAVPRQAQEVRAVGARRIRLREVETGRTYGPYEIRHGDNIVVGGKAYTIEVEIGEALDLEVVRRTPEQVKLEEKLRATILPSVEFSEAKVGEVAGLLSKEGGVNIVLTHYVRQESPDITITLRNIPLYDAIRYITEVVGVGFRVDDHAVVISEEISPPKPSPPPSPGRRGALRPLEPAAMREQGRGAGPGAATIRMREPAVIRVW